MHIGFLASNNICITNLQNTEENTPVPEEKPEIEKAAVGSQVPNADNSPQPTPETPLVSSSASDDASFKSKPEADNDNSSLGETAPTNNIQQENENVNTSQAENVEQSAENTSTLTDKCEMHETTHTKTGEKLWVISLKDKITTDKYKELSSIVKKVGGYYSRFAKTPDGKAIPGFIFKSKPDSEVIKVFNDFFGVAEKSTSPDTDMLKKSDDSDNRLL